MRLRRWLKALSLGFVIATVPGCKCTEDRPYTPFHVTLPSPSSVASQAVPSPSSAPPPDATGLPKAALIATSGPSDWTIDGVAFGVDKARFIDRALTADFDGDGKLDVVAWTRARAEAPETESSGELEVFDARTPAGRVVASAPPFVPGGAGCHHTVTLSQTGPHTVTLDFSARCDAPLLARSPTRSIAVIAPAGERAVVVALRVADPAPNESFDVMVDSSDRDLDGRDDVRATVKLHSSFDPAFASADLVWLDRAAGPSRDAAEPSRSFSAGAAEIAHFTGKTAERDGEARVANLRRLYATLCAEGGTARVFDSDGAPLGCYGVSSALKEVLVAEVRSAVTHRDAFAAAAAIGRDDWDGVSLTARDRTFLAKQLSTIAKRTAVVERALDVVPSPSDPRPHFSPLAFESDGALLVETAGGVTRVHLPDGTTKDAAPGTELWPVAVGAGAAPRWVGVAYPCDRSEVSLLLTDPNGSPLPPEPTRILSPRPGVCGGSGKAPVATLVPLEWSATAHVGFLGGALFGAEALSDVGAVVPRGAPRSPDGKTFVVATPNGVLVHHAGKTENWAARSTSQLGECVPSNGAAAVACTRGTRVVLLTHAVAPQKEK